MGVFDLRRELKDSQRLLFALAGIGVILLIWIVLTAGVDPIVNPRALPKPSRVFTAFGELYLDNNLVRNVFYSIGLNLAGYVEAILIAIPIGFVIGLFPVFRGMFQRPVDSIRYIPLTALIGIFIIWFGTQTPMKIHFLAFGIIIYMLPVIVQRIHEVNDVYLKTVYTLGATDWQTIKTVYFPAVMSKFIDDIRVLTAISWTYIIVIENIASEGGIGALIWRVGQRQARIDKVFALLIIIIIIGILTDRIFIYLDKLFFPHKYQQKESLKASQLQKTSVLDMIIGYVKSLLIWIVIALYIIVLINEFTGWLTDKRLFAFLFEEASWAIHLVFATIVGYKVWRLIKTRPKKSPQQSEA